LKLHVPELKKGEGDFLSYHGTIEFDDIKLDFLTDQYIWLQIDIQAAYVQKRVLLKGKWKSEVNANCHRCLSSFKLLLGEVIYDEFRHFTSGSEPGGEGEQIELSDGENFAFKGDTLDLVNYFRQLFLMSQPLKMLCSSDCKGLCSSCGANKNMEQCSCAEETIDPRWLALEQFKQH